MLAIIKTEGVAFGFNGIRPLAYLDLPMFGRNYRMAVCTRKLIVTGLRLTERRHEIPFVLFWG